MPLGSVTYENKAFQACYGDGHAASWPDSFTLHIYDGHPLDGGTELTAAGGYAPQTVANTSANFPAPVNGEQQMVLVAFPASTGAWSGVGTHVVLKDPSGVLVEFVRLARGRRINVTAAGAVVRVPLSLFHNDIEV